VLNYFSNTLRTTAAIVNVSMLYWLLIAIGISFLNLSLYAGYSENYTKYVDVFVITLSGGEIMEVKG